MSLSNAVSHIEDARLHLIDAKQIVAELVNEGLLPSLTHEQIQTVLADVWAVEGKVAEFANEEESNGHQ